MRNSDDIDTIIVFTARSPERIINEGGSQAWVLNPRRAKLCTWLLCTQNRHHPDSNFSDATEQHGSGFLLGKISSIRKSDEEDARNRWMIAISEYARIDISDAWDHGRNPVRYSSLKELGINLNKIRFESMPQKSSPPSSGAIEKTKPALAAMTITEAKKALATTYGVKPDAIEIIIRG